MKISEFYTKQGDYVSFEDGAKLHIQFSNLSIAEIPEDKREKVCDYLEAVLLSKSAEEAVRPKLEKLVEDLRKVR